MTRIKNKKDYFLFSPPPPPPPPIPGKKIRNDFYFQNQTVLVPSRASWLIGKSSACHAGGRGFQSRQGRELLILTKKDFNNLNSN